MNKFNRIELSGMLRSLILLSPETQDLMPHDTGSLLFPSLDVKIPDLLDAAHSVFVLEAANDGLDRVISRAALFRERLPDLPNGCPLHDSKLEFRQSEFRHLLP